MENTPYTSETIKLYKEMFNHYDQIGIVIQAYLHRSIDDIKVLSNDKFNVRICKGIYVEDPSLVLNDYNDIRDNYISLVKESLNNGSYVGIATHDEFLIDSLYSWILEKNISKDRYEFQVLHGVPMQKKLKKLMDDSQFEIIKTPYSSFQDPLNFKDTKTYKERFQAAQEKTNMDCAILVAYGKIKGIPVTCALHNFAFLGGSVGPSEAEALVKAAEHAVTYNTPLIIFTCSGGMRMMTNQYSLQALPKSTIAVQMVKDARLPYIVVLTDPTSGGVSASYASLGEITLAEPKSAIMFAGPSVTQRTTGEVIPEEVQTAEEMLKNGMIDAIVHRNDLRDNLAQIISTLLKRAA